MDFRTEIFFSLLLSLIIVQGFIFIIRKKITRYDFIYDNNWAKAIILSIPIFFIVNAISQSGFSLKFDFTDDYINLPGYLTFFATLLTAYLLFITLKSQRRATQISEFENRFFELIHLHRENVNELNFQSATGREVFSVIFDQYETLNKDLTEFFSNKEAEDIYEVKYLEKLRENETINNRKIDLVLYAKIDMLYLIVFLGMNESGKMAIIDYFKDRYKTDFYNSVLKHIELKPSADSIYWQDWLNKKYEKLENGYSEKFYSGHQFRLGHYYRHFFQSISYINKQSILTYQEKKDYIRLYRAQLSTYEQILLFLNSLSTLGRVWETENKYQPEKTIDINKQLITKYNLIKNLPNKMIGDIDVSKFYPDISYEALYDEEYEDMYGKRKTLCKLYN